MKISQLNPRYIKGLKALALGSLLATTPIKLAMREEPQVCDRFVKEVKHAKTIVVPDNYIHNGISIDWDMLGDISHGEAVSILLENGLPNVNILKRHVYAENENDKLGLIKNLNNLFDSMLEDIKQGKKYDAVNLSLGFSVSYEALSMETGLEITPEDVGYMTEYIKEALYKIPDDEFSIRAVPMKETIEAIKKMDELSKKGVKFYIAAGNSENRRFELFTLAENAIVVGALDKKGRKASYTADNSMINRLENGVVTSELTEDGYDLTGDGIMDFPDSRTTSWLKFWLPTMNIEGTSFATPRAIIKDFLNKTKKD